jgi:hypothetical protein
MTTYDYAKLEMERAGMFDGDMNQAMAEDVLALIKVFGEQGHSGMSAPFCLKMFARLASHKPIGPLTGDDSEWMLVGENMWQNMRYSAVFKDADHAYNIEGKVFRDPDGSCWTNSESRVAITFPYEVKEPEIVDRVE